MLNRIVGIGVAALMIGSAPTLAQTPPPSAGVSAPAIPNRSATGTHRAREQHRRTLNRQKARATAEHARQVRVAPNR